MSTNAKLCNSCSSGKCIMCGKPFAKTMAYLCSSCGFGTKGDQLKVVIVAIDENNGFLRVSLKKVPESEGFSTHNNNLRKAPETNDADFKSLEEKLPEWIATTLAEAKGNKNDD